MEKKIYEVQGRTKSGIEKTVDGKQVSDPKTHVVRSKKQIQAYKGIKDRERWEKNKHKNHWIACFHDPIKDLISNKSLSLNDLGFLLKLLPMMWFNRNGKLMRDHQNPLTVEDISIRMKISRRTAERHLKKLTNVGVLIKEKNPEDQRGYVYTVSKRFHHIGKMDNIHRNEAFDLYAFTKLYRSAKDKIDKLSLSEAGLMYKLLPFFHYKKYILSDAPDEQLEPERYFFTQKGLAAAIGESESTIKRNMKALIRHGIIMKTQAYNSVHYIVNPDIMFRLDIEDEYTEQVRKMFKDHEITSEM